MLAASLKYDYLRVKLVHKTLAEKHPSIKQYRCIGLFGCFDVHLPDGSTPQYQHLPVDEAFVAYKKVSHL